MPLSRHSPSQVGYLVDGFFFCADVVLPAAVLDKYKIPYLYSVTDHLQALERARLTPCAAVVPGHGPVVDSLAGLVDLNRGLIEEVAGHVFPLAAEPTTAEAVLTALLRQYGASVTDAPGFYLLQPTAYAFLSHLHRAGQIRHEVREERSLWSAM